MQNANLIPKSLWRTFNNQHRLVFDTKKRVVFYGARGGNVMSTFNSEGETPEHKFFKRNRVSI
jgi:hypothetical protein